MIWIILPLFLFSCASMSEKVRQGNDSAGAVVSCTPTLDPKALRPAVCGKCEISVEKGRLVVKETQSCPAYEVYRCVKKDGGIFLINNLTCTPQKP